LSVKLTNNRRMTMNERDRYLLKQGYEIGYLNAALETIDGVDLLNNSPKEEAERWIDEVIADNGGTAGEYVCHSAPPYTNEQ